MRNPEGHFAAMVCQEAKRLTRMADPFATGVFRRKLSVWLMNLQQNELLFFIRKDGSFTTEYDDEVLIQVVDRFIGGEYASTQVNLMGLPPVGSQEEPGTPDVTIRIDRK